MKRVDLVQARRNSIEQLLKFKDQLSYNYVFNDLDLSEEQIKQLYTIIENYLEALKMLKNSKSTQTFRELFNKLTIPENLNQIVDQKLYKNYKQALQEEVEFHKQNSFDKHYIYQLITHIFVAIIILTLFLMLLNSAPLIANIILGSYGGFVLSSLVVGIYNHFNIKNYDYKIEYFEEINSTEVIGAKISSRNKSIKKVEHETLAGDDANNHPLYLDPLVESSIFRPANKHDMSKDRSRDSWSSFTGTTSSDSSSGSTYSSTMFATNQDVKKSGVISYIEMQQL